MAAEAEAEAEGWRRLLRAVTRLQACVRGYLLRKRFRSLRAEYEEVMLEIEGDLSRLAWRGRLLPRPVFAPEQAVPGKRPGPGEPTQGDEGSPGNPQEEPDAPEPDGAGGCGGVKPTGEGRAESPPNAGTHPIGGASSSSVPCVWDGAMPWAQAPEAEPEIPLEDIKDLPRTRSGLQAYRNHLVMELLWLQQAIASRENYLMLRQRLGTPGP